VRRVKAQKEAGEGGACWPLVSRMVNWGRVVRPPVTEPTARIPAVPLENIRTATSE